MMTNLEEIEKSDLEQMAWETNLQVRDKIIDLRFNPPQVGTALETLTNETGTLLRMLDEYHSHLYLRELGEKQDSNDFFSKEQNPNQLAVKLENYSKWRKKQLGSLQDAGNKLSPVKERLQKLEDLDEQKFNRLFGTELYNIQSSEYRNHWHMVALFGDNEKTFIDFGDNHADVTFSDIIASFKSGFRTQFYHGSTLYVDDKTYTSGIREGIVKNTIEGQGKDLGNPNPNIEIQSNGNIVFDM